MSAPAAENGRGYTPRELAAILRVGPDRVRGWIQSGQLGAINTAAGRCGKPRYVVLPKHLAEFEQARRIKPPAEPPARRRRVAGPVDYFPD